MNLLVGFLVLAAVTGQPSERTQWLMGSALRIAVPAGLPDSVYTAAFDDVRELEDLLSTWREDTPLQRLNRAAAGRHEIPLALHDYLLRARHDHERTHGVFDPSVGTLRSGASAPIGMRRLELEREGDRAFATKPHSDFAVDSGGDGKGLAVDAVVDRLRAAGVETAVVDFGGSSWFALGTAPDGSPWRVVLSTPEGEVLGNVALSDQALSVSSTFRVDVDSEGRAQRIAHLIDPRTRATVEADRTVAVIAPTATEAEVWSTAIAVAGWDEARAWVPATVAVAVFEDGEAVVVPPSFRAE